MAYGVECGPRCRCECSTRSPKRERSWPMQSPDRWNLPANPPSASSIVCRTAREFEGVREGPVRYTPSQMSKYLGANSSEVNWLFLPPTFCGALVPGRGGSRPPRGVFRGPHGLRIPPRPSETPERQCRNQFQSGRQRPRPDTPIRIRNRNRRQVRASHSPPLIQPAPLASRAATRRDPRTPYRHGRWPAGRGVLGCPENSP